MTRVLLTGATGVWGRATVRLLREGSTGIPGETGTGRPDLQVVALARPTPADRRILAEFADVPGLTVAWGDVTDEDSVTAALRGVDLVLHVAALVSPAADLRPDLAHRVNVEGMRTIIRAVRAQPNPDAIGVIGVGSVAELGSRNPPRHWARVGDPVRASRFDAYAQTKIAAERELVDSGLACWAWLRQTGILHPGVLALRDPIFTHMVLAGPMEWVSAEDSARLLLGVCDPDLPARFWGRVHHVGGGAGWRMTNGEFMDAVGRALRVSDIHRWFERNWFATGNFHGAWFADSDDLAALVPFRRDRFEDAMARAAAAQRPLVRAARYLPGVAVRAVTRHQALAPRGTLHALRHGPIDHVEAHFGTRADWERIGTWSAYQPERPDPEETPTILDHGYDEALDPEHWDAAVLAEAAAFRGGVLLSGPGAPGTSGAPGTPGMPGMANSSVSWECAFGHRFSASPWLVLHAGHWCPVCVTAPEDYPQQARRNRFLAQLDGA